LSHLVGTEDGVIISSCNLSLSLSLSLARCLCLPIVLSPSTGCILVEEHIFMASAVASSATYSSWCNWACITLKETFHDYGLCHCGR
jgi:hypothetical protein